jgi:hypothetical protein
MTITRNMKTKIPMASPIHTQSESFSLGGGGEVPDSPKKKILPAPWYQFSLTPFYL